MLKKGLLPEGFSDKNEHQYSEEVEEKFYEYLNDYRKRKGHSQMYRPRMYLENMMR